MKAPKTSILTAFLAALFAVGCTVNIHTRPSAEPSPEPEEQDSEEVLVSPTRDPQDEATPRRRTEPENESVRRTTGTTITRREAPPRPNPDSVRVEEDSTAATVRRTTGTTITRYEDPPKVDPDTAAESRRSTEESERRRTAQDTTSKEPPDRPGEGRGRDESQEKYPGKGDPPGLDKEKKTEVQPDSVSETPPDRPGVGKGRDESQERYPGRGEATGLEKQQDKAKENPGQEKATDEDEKRNSKPEEEPVNERSEGNRTQPEVKKETAASARPSSNNEAESKRETAATERANDGKKSDDRSDRRTASEPAVSEPDAAAVPTLDIPSKELPPPGKCRVWIPGRSAGEQAKAGKCDDVDSGAPARSWVLYRPQSDKDVVHVKQIDERRPGVVTKVLAYEVATGEFIGEVGR